MASKPPAALKEAVELRGRPRCSKRVAFWKNFLESNYCGTQPKTAAVAMVFEWSVYEPRAQGSKWKFSVRTGRAFAKGAFIEVDGVPVTDTFADGGNLEFEMLFSKGVHRIKVYGATQNPTALVSVYFTDSPSRGLSSSSQLGSSPRCGDPDFKTGGYVMFEASGPRRAPRRL